MNQFSIILPVRNGGIYIKECVNSILAQTYSNFSLIILDNNSTDGTKQWIESLNNDKIIIYPSTKDLSITENWARAVDVPKNEFMTLIGHDDILYPNFLEEINNLINTNPTASLYHTHFNYINSNGKIIRAGKAMPTKLSFDEFLKLFLKNEIDVMGTGYVCRSIDYEKLGGISTKYPNLLFADFALWLNLTELSYEVISPKNCFAFRLHQSTTTTSSNEKFLNGFEVFIDYLCVKKQNQIIKKSIDQYAIQYINKYTQGIVHRLIKTPLSKRANNETVINFIRRIKKCQNKLISEVPFKPYKNFTVLLAKWIDSNIATHKLFLLYKSIFSKPIFD